MNSFWHKLQKPFTCLAPMHDVTDTAFRQIVMGCGRPDVLYTEFVSIDGLLHEKSHDRIIRYYLQYDNKEHPLVAQIWGNDPKKFAQAAKIIEKLGFDGVDINMGCPDKKVVAMQAGAGHIIHPDQAIACIRATQDATSLPVSVKTRLGFDAIDLGWVETLMNSGIPALALHLRTKKEMSKVPAHWEMVAEVEKLKGRKNVLLIGNGDTTAQQVKSKLKNMDGLDGIMIGRGVLGNPWIFSDQGKPSDLGERLVVLKAHAELFKKYFTGIKSFAMLKKHIRAYVGSHPGAKKMRERFMQTKTVDELIEQTDASISQYAGV